MNYIFIAAAVLLVASTYLFKSKLYERSVWVLLFAGAAVVSWLNIQSAACDASYPSACATKNWLVFFGSLAGFAISAVIFIIALVKRSKRER